MAGRVGWVDPRADVDETAQIQAPAEPDQSAEVQRTRVCASTSSSVLASTSRAPRSWRTTARRASAGSQARRAGLPARDGVPHPPVTGLTGESDDARSRATGEHDLRPNRAREPARGDEQQPARCENASTKVTRSEPAANATKARRDSTSERTA